MLFLGGANHHVRCMITLRSPCYEEAHVSHVEKSHEERHAKPVFLAILFWILLVCLWPQIKHHPCEERSHPGHFIFFIVFITIKTTLVYTLVYSSIVYLVPLVCKVHENKRSCSLLYFQQLNHASQTLCVQVTWGILFKFRF